MIVRHLQVVLLSHSFIMAEPCVNDMTGGSPRDRGAHCQERVVVVAASCDYRACEQKSRHFAFDIRTGPNAPVT